MTQKRFHIPRRNFLRSLSLASTGLPVWFLQRDLDAAPVPASTASPNARPRLALVGAGGMGSGDARNASRFGDIVAVCDADERRLQKAVDSFTKDGKKPETFRDFRKVMQRSDIDAVINGTPDHWHTLVNMAAVQSGKDVYGEKPLTLTIDEGKRLVAAVRKHKAVLQTGSQQRSDRRFRLACELIRNGRLGKLQKVTVFLPEGLREGPFASAPVPEGLNWDLWQGQAPGYAYVPQRCHTNFRFWWDYSGGTMTDWGAHHNDIARWAIGLPGPISVNGAVLQEPIPGGYTAVSSYRVAMNWSNGVVQEIRSTPDDTIFGGRKNKEGQRNGIRFEGTDGWLWVNRGELDASDRDLIRTPLPDDAVKLYESGDHMGNFFECMQSRKPPIAEAEEGHRSATICHLGAISLRVRKPMTWDPERQRFTGENAREGNAHVTREMRKPYDYSYIA